MRRGLQILPLLIFSILFFLLSAYSLSGLQAVARQPYVSTVFWFVVSLSVFALGYALQGMRSRGMGSFFKIATHVFLILFVSELFFAAVLFSGDVYRLFAGLFQFSVQHRFSVPTRNPYLVGLAISIFITTIALFIYGIWKGKYAYQVIHHTLTFRDLPEAFDGFTLTQISDVHAGSFTDAKAVQRGIELINKQESDLFVFTGDLVNNKAEEIRPWIRYFSQIKAPFG